MCKIYFLFTGICDRVYSYSGGRFLKDKIFDDVSVRSDIAYGSSVNFRGLRETRYLDLYVGKGNDAPRSPVLVFVHGGGYRMETDKTQGYAVHYAREFAKRGYVAVSIEYRRRESAVMPTRASELPALMDGVEDLNTALGFLRSSARELRINPQAMFLAGGSAGGRIAVGMSLYNNELPDWKFNREGVAAAANLWGSPEAELRWYRVTGDGVPMVIIHGEDDDIIPCRNSLDLAGELERAGIRHELHIIKGARHPPNGSGIDGRIETWMSDFFAAAGR